MNKINLFCTKYQKITNNRNNNRIKQELDGKVRLYSECIDLRFKNIVSIYKEDLDYLLEELSIEKKSRYRLLNK